MVDLVVRSDRLGTFRKKFVDKWKAEASFCDIAIPLIPYETHAPPPIAVILRMCGLYHIAFPLSSDNRSGELILISWKSVRSARIESALAPTPSHPY